MQQVFLGAALLLTTTSLFLLAGALFPKITGNSREVIENSQGRTFWIGVVNLLFLAAILLISIFLVERVGLLPVFSIPGLAAVAAFAIWALVGLTSITHLIGERILPEHAQPKRNIWAAIILILALLTPFIGWYLFFPYTVILGLGGVVTTVYREWRLKRKSEEGEE